MPRPLASQDAMGTGSNLAAARSDANGLAHAGRMNSSSLFGAIAEEWLRTALHLRPSTAARVDGIIRDHLLPAFGDRPAKEISPADLRVFLTEKYRNGASAATVRKTYSVLRCIFDAAKEVGAVDQSPCVGIKLPAASLPEARYLSAQEVERLAAAVGKRYRALVLLAAYGGLRWAEMIALRRSDIDVGGSRVTITQTMVEVSGRFHAGPPKSSRGRRVVTLPRFVTEALKGHIERYPSADGLIFTQPRGGPLRRSNFRRRVWLPALRAACLSPLRVHDLRHTSAALAIEAGGHPKAIQHRLGHASIEMTLDRYGHLFPSLDEELATRLDVIGRAAKG